MAPNNNNGNDEMSNNDMTLQLPTEIVERAVRDKISAAIASQLGDPEVMIQKLVGAALAQKVNEHGKVSNSSYENRHAFLEVMMGSFVRDSAREALMEYMDENKQKIKDAVKKDIAKSSSKIAKVFVDGLVESFDSRFSSKVEIRFDNKDEE